MAKRVKIRTDWDTKHPLKVGELIEILKNFDQDSTIRVSDGVRDIYDFAVADDGDGTFFAISRVD